MALPGDAVERAPETDRPHYRLEDLLVGMSREAMRDAFDWGSDRGREGVEYGNKCAPAWERRFCAGP